MTRPRGARGTGRGRSLRSVGSPDRPGDGCDVVGACEAVIAVLDGRNVAHLLRGMTPEARADVLGGLIALVCYVGEKLVGGDRPDVFRAALAELQAHARLERLFQPEPEETP